VLAHLEELVRQSGSTLDELCGLSTRSVAELLVEVGDPRRFTEGGFARFNGSAPLPASTAEGPGEPVRHRFNPGGNRADQRDPAPDGRHPVALRAARSGDLR
jgi:transposase